MNTFKWLGRLAMVCFLITLSACSPKPKDLILGKWKESDGSTAEFFKDGTLQMIYNGSPVVCTYSIMDKDHLKLDLNGQKQMVMTFAVSTEHLTLNGDILSRVGGSTAPTPAPQTAKPKPIELTRRVLTEAFQRASINTLPVFLKISDVQFQVVNSVDTKRVIQGNLTLEFLQDTFKPAQLLKYHNGTVNYQIQLLKGVMKKGQQVSVPFSARIDLSHHPLTVPMPALENYGSEAVKFSHAYLEGSEVAMKAEKLIQAATEADRKAAKQRDRYTCLTYVKDSLANADALDNFLHNNPYGNYFACMHTAFGDLNFTYKWNGAMNGAQSLKERYAAHCKLVKPLFDEAYPPIEKIIQDAKAKDKACEDYLLNLQG